MIMSCFVKIPLSLSLRRHSHGLASLSLFSCFAELTKLTEMASCLYKHLLCQDFLSALSEAIPSNAASLENYHRMVDPICSPEPGDPEAALTRRALYHTVGVRRGAMEGEGVCCRGLGFEVLRGLSRVEKAGKGLRKEE